MNVREITTPKSGKVLTVNCDPEVMRILEVNLTHANLEVISAGSGAAALRKVYTEKPDIILLDPTLPDMDGMEICQQLKKSQHSSHIPVILIGGKSRSKHKTAAVVDGAIHNITKPFDPKEVVALVQAYLKQKERTENINPLSGLPKSRVRFSRLAIYSEKVYFRLGIHSNSVFPAAPTGYNVLWGSPRARALGSPYFSTPIINWNLAIVTNN